MFLGIFCLIFGFIIGYLWRDSRPEKKKQAPTRNVYLSYNERQRAKIRHQSDAERIRELNLLSTNESKFMRLLQHQFTEYKLIIKDRRFYIADQDYYPIAIFEYRDGTKELRLKDQEDGIPVFLYKAILSSEALEEDKKSIKSVFSELSPHLENVDYTHLSQSFIVSTVMRCEPSRTLRHNAD